MQIKLILRAAASLGLIWFILQKIDLQKTLHLLASTHLSWVIAGWSLTFVVLTALAFRWRLFLKKQSLNLPFTHVFSLTWSGQFFNCVLPGSTGGDFMKIYQLCRQFPGRRASAAATVLVDRVIALFALLVLGAIAFLLHPFSLSNVLGTAQLPSPVLLWSAFGVLTIGSCAGAIFIYRSKKWKDRAVRFLVALRENATPSPSLAAAFFLAMATHATNFLAIYFFARSLSIQITYSQVLIFMPVLFLFIMIPITISGHGLREMLLIFYFTHFGVSIDHHSAASVADAAIALSALMVMNDLLWAIPGGIVYALRVKKHEPPPAAEAQLSDKCTVEAAS